MPSNSQIWKITKTLLWLVFVWAFLILIMWPNAVLAAKEAEIKVIGLVSALEGTVEAQIRGEVAWERLAEKDDVYLGDKIRTKANSKVKVVFKDDSIISLGPESLMELKEFDYFPDKEQRISVFSVAQGKARAIVGRLFGSDSKFEIETPTAVAGVRGTHFVVWVVSPEITRVFVLEGRITVRNIRPDVIGEVQLTPGKASTVQEEAPPAAPETATEKEMQEAITETKTEEKEETKEATAAPPPPIKKVQEIKKVEAETGIGPGGGAKTGDEPIKILQEKIRSELLKSSKKALPKPPDHPK